VSDSDSSFKSWVDPKCGCLVESVIFEDLTIALIIRELFWNVQSLFDFILVEVRSRVAKSLSAVLFPKLGESALT
jgi:hypothetical protein